MERLVDRCPDKRGSTVLCKCTSHAGTLCLSILMTAMAPQSLTLLCLLKIASYSCVVTQFSVGSQTESAICVVDYCSYSLLVSSLLCLAGLCTYLVYYTNTQSSMPICSLLCLHVVFKPNLLYMPIQFAMPKCSKSIIAFYAHVASFNTLYQYSLIEHTS